MASVAVVGVVPSHEQEAEPPTREVGAHHAHADGARLHERMVLSSYRESLPTAWAGGCRCRRVVDRASRALEFLQSSPSYEARYSPRFKAMAILVVGLSTTWVGNYMLAVLPTIEAQDGSSCTYNDNQLTYSANMLFVYFVWFAIARLSLFVPCVAARIAHVQSRTHGFCITYCIHLLLRDGPLYIFAVGSVLFWFHLMQSPNCERGSPELYMTLKLYAIYSCLVSAFCLILAYWHNKILIDATREHGAGREDPSAPPDTIKKLETRPYDSELFGDEDGKTYPAECAICLLAWEEDDVIKVTPCGHTFHEECLGNWLRTARTCALCRQDLSAEPPAELVPSHGRALAW